MTRLTSSSLLIFASVAFLWNCTKKVAPVDTRQEVYSEDLSGLRPVIKEYAGPELPKSDQSSDAVMEPRLDVTGKVNILLDSMAELNKKTQFSQFTILVINSNDRETAEQSRLEIFRLLPGSKPTLEFIPPSYRVKVGRFFNRFEAYQTLVKLKDEFPNAIIIPEPVYYK